MRLIDADELFQKAIGIIKDKTGDKEFGILNEIVIAKTIEVKPVKHGKWIEKLSHIQEFECSVCSESLCFSYDICFYKHNYCPFCGAKMDGGDESE